MPINLARVARCDRDDVDADKILSTRVWHEALVLAIGFACAALPVAALAQTPAGVIDTIKQLQSGFWLRCRRPSC